MKPANASAMRSTTDQVSVHRHIRSPDELTLSLRPSQSQMSWRPSDSACGPDVKGRGHAGRSARSFVGGGSARADPSRQRQVRTGNILVKVTLSKYAASGIEPAFFRSLLTKA